MGDEPKFTPSKSVLRLEEAFTLVTREDNPFVVTRAWRAVFPLPDDRISTAYPENRFSMYEVYFKEMEFRLPFTELQIRVFHHMDLVPSHFTLITSLS